MGDSIDNVKGVPGIGEKGARDLIATYGSLDALLAARRRGDAEEAARGADDPRRRRPAEPRAGDDSTPTCRVTFDPERAPLPGRVARALLRAVLDARLPHARHRVRADGATRSSRTTRSSTSIDGVERAGRRDPARRPRLPLRRRRRRHGAGRAALVGWPGRRRLGHGRRATCRSARPRWSGDGSLDRDARRSRCWRRCSRTPRSPRSATTSRPT